MKKICLGKITDAHGVKGLVKIFPYGEDLSLIEGQVFTQDDQPLTIHLKNPLGKYILAAIEGIADRNAAENLKGTEIFISRETLPETEEGQYYIEDLKDMDVVEDGEVIGTVIQVDNFGASDLLYIRLKNGGAFYLPFMDEYVLEVDEKIFIKKGATETFNLN